MRAASAVVRQRGEQSRMNDAAFAHHHPARGRRKRLFPRPTCGSGTASRSEQGEGAVAHETTDLEHCVGSPLRPSSALRVSASGEKGNIAAREGKSRRLDLFAKNKKPPEGGFCKHFDVTNFARLTSPTA
jgi:hypothetical protein